MNSKQLACLFLVLYVAVLAIVFPLVRFTTTTEEEKLDNLVYMELVMPEEEEEKNVKIKPQPQRKTKKTNNDKAKGENTNVSTKKNDQLSSNPNSETDDALEAKGQEETPKTVDEKALLTHYIQGNTTPIAQGNAGEESDKTAGTSNFRDGFDAYGITIPGAEGGDPSRKLRGGSLPQPDKKLIKDEGLLYLKLKVDKAGNVISVSIDKNKKSTISDPTTRNAIVDVVKKKAKFDPGESDMMVDVEYVVKQQSNK